LYQMNSFQNFIVNSATEFSLTMENDIPEESHLSVPEIIKLHGYSCLELKVTTTDGFQLSVFRVEKPDIKPNGPAVLLQHGLLADAANWISNGKQNSFAFMLVEAGFDVYLANSRGNRYSREHVILKPNEPEFWKWSWQEMAKYDLPATIDIVLETSNKKNLYYIGHSQGTLTMFTHLSECLNVSDRRKIRVFFALAPIGRLKHIRSNIRHLAPVSPLAEMGQWLLGGAELLPSTPTGRWVANQMSKVQKSVATISPVVDDKANSLFTSVTGFNPSHYFKQYLPVYSTHTPAGTSLQNMIHFAQMVQSQKMQKYDFKDEETNKNRYLSVTPPEIELENVTVPIVAFYGTEDDLSTVEDAEWALDRLPNVVERVKLDGFDHMDFLWGTRAPTYLYAEIIDFIKDASINFDYTQPIK